MKHSSFPQTALGLQISLSLPLISPFLPPPLSPTAFVQPDNPLLNPKEHIFGTGTIKKKRDKLICISYLGDSLAKSSTVSLTQRQERWSCKSDMSLLRLRGKGVGGWSELTAGDHTVGNFACCLNTRFTEAFLAGLEMPWAPSPRLSRCMQFLFPSSLARTEQGEQPPARWGVHTPC